MDVGEAEAEAKARANSLVAAMLQRPDQLDRVDLYRRRFQQKKSSIEAHLKTAMQSQLDGVRTGLSQLQSTFPDLKAIKSSLTDIEECLVDVPELSKQLYDCHEEYLRHSQYAAAMENLKHIFTVPESVEKTQKWIADGKLLYAHQCLVDLENSRDDLLFELHKLPHQNAADISNLTNYFSKVEKLSEDLGKQVWVILQRTLNIVRKEPVQMVTALRIIEREERADEFALKRQEVSGFLPAGRPKKWRNKAFLVLETAVQQRIEGNQFEDRSSNKNWLIRHLEMIRLLMLEDLKVVQSLCVPCFPPKYNIVNRYVQMYHSTLSNHLIELIDGGLEDNEYVSLLSWVLNTYEGKDLMSHPSLKIDMSKLTPLLQNDVLEQLIAKYLENVKVNYESWMVKALELEEKEWYRSEPPQQDADSHYKTELPQLLHDMIRQNLDVAGTISPVVQMKVLITSVEEMRLFASKLKGAIHQYKCSYYSDRSQIQYFTTYVIALANSSQEIMDVMAMVKSQFWHRGMSASVDTRIVKEFEAFNNSYQSLRDVICDVLLEEALVDLQDQFGSLLTSSWLASSEPMDTICLTLRDYYGDYTRLHQRNFEHVVQLGLNTVATRYTTAILQKRLTLRSPDDRKKTAERIAAEAEQLQAVFESVAADSVKFDSPCEVLKGLAEVLRVNDVEFLDLELHRLLRRYPDMTNEHLTAILSLRGDLSRQDIRQRVAEILNEMKSHRTGPFPKSIFSHVQISTSLFL